MQTKFSRLNTIKMALFAIALGGLLAGCATRGPVIRSDHDRSVNFAALKTFGFPEQTGTDRGGYATLVTSHFKEAIKREMAVRGYTYAETDADMLINFYSESHDRTRVYPSATGRLGVYYGRPWYGWYSAWPFYYPYLYDDVSVVQYKSGVFKIDAVDPKRQQTIWEASTEERLSEQSLDNPQPTIARLVTEMFKKVPHGAAARSP